MAFEGADESPGGRSATCNMGIAGQVSKAIHRFAVVLPSDQRLASGVAIPTAFFKIIAKVDEANELRVVSVVVPQEADDFATIGRYLTSVDEVESLTGLDFLSLLDDTIEDQLEADQPRRLW